MTEDRPPQQPDVPPADERRRELLRWAWRLPVLLAAIGAGVGGYEAWRVHFSKRRPSANPVFEPGEALRIAAVASLERLWSAAPFVYRGLPAFVLRLPEPIAGGVSVEGAHFAAFSRICTHQDCVIEWNTNPEAVAVAANYRSDRPALVCGCHLSVFDPVRAGRAVSGPAVAPLPRLALELRGGELYAVGIERAPGRG